MADDKDIKERYAELKKKFNLPEFDTLENDFEIWNVEDQNLLRGIRRRMCEKLEHYAKMLEDYIQPDSSFSSMYEVKDFDEKGRQKIMMLFKKVMVFYKEGIRLNLNIGEKEDAAFIADLFKEWQEIRPELMAIIEVTKATWKSKDSLEKYQNYLG